MIDSPSSDGNFSPPLTLQVRLGDALPRRIAFLNSLRNWLLFMGLLAYAAFSHAATPESWVISLGWSPQYCRDNPAEFQKEAQCRENHGFELSGLKVVPTTQECDAGPMERADVERGLWSVPNRTLLKKILRRDGACSGLGLEEYMVQLDRARRRLNVPEEYQEGVGSELPAERIVDAFVHANEGMKPEAIALSCKGGWLQEVKICADGKFEFQRCSVEVAGKCPPDIKLRSPGRLPK